MPNQEKLTETIGLLLNKADRTDNPHEKEAFYEQAQRLAARHSIDLARARQKIERGAQREEPVVRTVKLGVPRQRGLAQYVELFMAIGGANDLRFTIAQNSTFINAMGFPSDIDVTETLYNSLVTAMVREADAWLATGEFRKETAFTKNWWDEPKPMSKITARINFYSAYAARIGSRLRRAKAAEVAAAVQRDEAGIDPRPDNLTTELVLREKKAEVEEFYAANTADVRGSYRGGRTSAMSYAARNAGRNAAERAHLGGSTSTLSANRTALTR